MAVRMVRLAASIVGAARKAAAAAAKQRRFLLTHPAASYACGPQRSRGDGSSRRRLGRWFRSAGSQAVAGRGEWLD